MHCFILAMSNTKDKRIPKFKIVVSGDSGVGKSCMIRRFMNDTFGDKIPTLGVDKEIKEIIIRGETVKLELWDTAGSEKYHSLTPNFYRGAQGAMLVYDVTRRDSLQNLTRWMAELALHSRTDTKLLIVGHKTDLKDLREVSTDLGRLFAKKRGARFCEASSESGLGISFAFKSLALQVYETRELWEEEEETINLDDPTSDHSWYTCGGRICT